jgi:hypothetical protein
LKIHLPYKSDPLTEKILLKLLNNQDKEFHSTYYNALLTSLMSLFKQKNPGYAKNEEWEFIKLNKD